MKFDLNDYDNLIVVFIIFFLLVLPLLIGIYITINRKKQNKSIWEIILIISLFEIFTIFPFMFSIIKKDGLSFFMAIIMECYTISVALPWLVLFVFSFLFIKKLNKMSSSKKALAILLFFLLLVGCIVITVTKF